MQAIETGKEPTRLSVNSAPLEWPRTLRLTTMNSSFAIFGDKYELINAARAVVERVDALETLDV